MHWSPVQSLPTTQKSKNYWGPAAIGDPRLISHSDHLTIWSVGGIRSLECYWWYLVSNSILRAWRDPGTRDQREVFFEVWEVNKKKLSLFFEKCKVKEKCFHSFLRSGKWKKMHSLFFEKWNVKSKCLKFEIEKWKFSRILNNSREPRFLNRYIP